MAPSEPVPNSRVQFSKNRGFGVASGPLVTPVDLGVGLLTVAGPGEEAEGPWREDAERVGGRDIEPAPKGVGAGPPLPPQATAAKPAKGTATAIIETKILTRIIIL